MAEGCMYCEAGDERRLELMTPIVDLKVSSLHFYREQSYPGRCVLVYHKHIQKLTDLEPEEYMGYCAGKRVWENRGPCALYSECLFR